MATESVALYILCKKYFNPNQQCKAQFNRFEWWKISTMQIYYYIRYLRVIENVYFEIYKYIIYIIVISFWGEKSKFQVEMNNRRSESMNI